LTPGSIAKITVDYALTQYLALYPKEIAQSENQYTITTIKNYPITKIKSLRLVLYSGYANILSVYQIMKETCSYKIGGTKPLSFTEVAPNKYTVDKIVYGPYENSPAYMKVI
jgi:hypothetical protein